MSADAMMDTASPASVAMDDDTDEKLVDSAMESPKPVDADMTSEVEEAPDTVMKSPLREDVVMESASSPEAAVAMEAVAMEAEESSEKAAPVEEEKDECADGGVPLIESVTSVQDVDDIAKDEALANEEVNNEDDVTGVEPTEEVTAAAADVGDENDVTPAVEDDVEPTDEVTASAEGVVDEDDVCPVGIISSVVGNAEEPDENATDDVKETDDVAPVEDSIVSTAEFEPNQDEEPMFQISCVQSGVSLDNEESNDNARASVSPSVDGASNTATSAVQADAGSEASASEANEVEKTDDAPKTTEESEEKPEISEIKIKEEPMDTPADSASTKPAATTETPTAEKDESGSVTSAYKERPPSTNSVVSSSSVKIKSEPVESSESTKKPGKEASEPLKAVDSTPAPPKQKEGEKKEKKKKHHKCIVCGNVGKCKYNIVRNGDVKHLCNDQCFKTFRATPSQFLTNQGAAEQPPEPSPPPKKSVKGRSCATCSKSQQGRTALVWQTLEFCSETCLERLQKSVKNECGSCRNVVSKPFSFCTPTTDAKKIVQFCSAQCQEEHANTVKSCAYCEKDLHCSAVAFMAPVNNGTVFHDFCSPACHQVFEKRVASLQSSLDPVTTPTKEKDGERKSSRTTRASSGMATCSVCSKMTSVKHDITLENKSHKFCSDTCFAAFRYAKKVKSNLCDHCNTPCDYTAKSMVFEGVDRKFCANACLHAFRGRHKKSAPCTWCAQKKHNFDMIEMVEVGKYHYFCSSNCMSLFKSNIQASGNKSIKCDFCSKWAPAQYHLTMSDATVRNFCSYKCVMSFQDQFKTKAPAPPPSRLPPASATFRGMQPRAPVAQLQQRVPNMGLPRVPNMMPRLNGTTLVMKSQAGTTANVPIISNVMSLAPLAKEAGPPKPTTQVQGTQMTTKVITKKETTTVQPPAALMRNKAVMCKPVSLTKATTCRPHSVSKSVQSDEAIGLDGIPIPIPVPIYIPVPIVMYTMPTPQAVPIPVPVPIPIFIPVPTGSAGSTSAEQVLEKIKDIKERIPEDPFEAELLMMAEAVAGESPAKKSSVKASETNGDVARKSSDALFSSEADMLSMALKMAEQMEGDEDPILDLELTLDKAAEPEVEEPSTRRGTKRGAKGRPKTRSKRQKVSEEEEPPPPAQPPQPKPPDADCILKYTYGVNAWKHWVKQKNVELEKEAKTNPRIRVFKNELLECSVDELNHSLSLFVREVRKPNGEEYAPDSIFYLCLGIQAYLFNNNRADNIFTDVYYEKFTDCLDEIAQRFAPKIGINGQLTCRIEEEQLWECKQLGAHSPHVLLNTLIYFNTRCFGLKTPEQHLKLAFSHVMKAWKRNPAGSTPSRSVYLRYYAPVSKEAMTRKRRDENDQVFEQMENTTNPLRCPVKLYEFYLSKCPESIKHRSDLFYLLPERSCVPDSPVWFSVVAIGQNELGKMLNRVNMMKELNLNEDDDK